MQNLEFARAYTYRERAPRIASRRGALRRDTTRVCVRESRAEVYRGRPVLSSSRRSLRDIATRARARSCRVIPLVPSSHFPAPFLLLRRRRRVARVSRESARVNSLARPRARGGTIVRSARYAHAVPRNGRESDLVFGREKSRTKDPRETHAG